MLIHEILFRPGEIATDSEWMVYISLYLVVAAEEARPSPSLAGLAEERSTLPRMAEGLIHFRQTPLRSPTTREGVRRRTAEERSSPILPGSRSRFDLNEERLRS